MAYSWSRQKRSANAGLIRFLDFMNRCGCGRAVFKSDGEPAMVAMYEAGKNARQSDTIFENSQKGDSQSSGAAGNAVLPCLVSHTGVVTKR